MYTQLIANYEQLNTKLISNVGEINDISARIVKYLLYCLGGDGSIGQDDTDASQCG